MDDISEKRHICGNCGRVSERDIGRGFCPVSANRVTYGRPADGCVLYIKREKPHEGGRSEDVREGD